MIWGYHYFRKHPYRTEKNTHSCWDLYLVATWCLVGVIYWSPKSRKKIRDFSQIGTFFQRTNPWVEVVKQIIGPSNGEVYRSSKQPLLRGNQAYIFGACFFFGADFGWWKINDKNLGMLHSEWCKRHQQEYSPPQKSNMTTGKSTMNVLYFLSSENGDFPVIVWVLLETSGVFFQKKLGDRHLNLHDCHC